MGGGVLCHFAVGLIGVFRIGWVFGWRCVFGNFLGGWLGDIVWELYDLIMPVAEGRGGWRRFGEYSWLCDCGAKKERRDQLSVNWFGGPAFDDETGKGVVEARGRS